jgi:hypothetical protein
VPNVGFELKTHCLQVQIFKQRQRIKNDDNNRIKAFDDFICWGLFWFFAEICEQVSRQRPMKIGYFSSKFK